MNIWGQRYPDDGLVLNGQGHWDPGGGWAGPQINLINEFRVE